MSRSSDGLKALPKIWGRMALFTVLPLALVILLFVVAGVLTGS